MRWLIPVCALLTACGSDAELEDLVGMWGRVVDGEHEIWELAESIDGTGLEDVRPAFRRYEYPIDEEPAEVARGRWNIISGDLIITPVWSLVDDEANRTSTLVIDDYNPRLIALIWPGEEEPVTYVTVQDLPRPAEAE